MKQFVLIALVLSCLTYFVTQVYLEAVQTSEFKTSLCYSRIFHEISNLLEHANESENLTKHKELAMLLDSLKVGNYDTDCQKALDVLLANNVKNEV